MKQIKRFCVPGIFTLIFAALMAGCASKPVLGQPTELQVLLNAMPAIPISGKNLKIDFGGDVWIGKVDGNEYLAGTYKSEDTAEGSLLTLTPTHAYSKEKTPGAAGVEIGWVETPGAKIVLDYKKGPPSSLTLKK